MLHDLAFFQIAVYDAVDFFFHIFDLPVMAGQEITVFVFVLQLPQGIHIALEHAKVCLLGTHDGNNGSHELVSHKHELFLWFIQATLSEGMPL